MMNAMKRVGAGIGLMLIALMTTSIVQAAQFQIHVVDGNGNPLPADNGFRWVLQEDTTYFIDPANPPAIDEQLALNFHKSHHPIAMSQRSANNPVTHALKGNVDGESVNVTEVTPGRYYLSILPYSGYAMGGIPVTVLPNAQDPDNTLDAATVTVQAHPIPTAQISVYLFQDCYPLNGAPDLPEEEMTQDQNGNWHTTSCPTPIDFTRFKVIIEEPAGKYGANGGPLLQNAFGDPLGTRYEQTCDANGQTDADPATTYGCLNADGTPKVASLGDGTLTPNPDGTLLVQNLAPGKYGVLITPPTGAGWIQTTTIEGTPVNDAWVKANEPPYFVEFGPPGPHVFFGFTQAFNNLSGTSGGGTVSGLITDMHMSRPIDTTLYSGRPFPQCVIAVNESNAGPNVYTEPCNADSSFEIANVPPGSYELKVFDEPLDVVIATMAFTVDPSGTCNGGQSCAFGNVPVFNWNNRLTNYLFNDDNQNGFWDVGETNLGAESGPVNIRWRDGTVYQSFPTDFDGLAPFDEAFPWFNWMVAEVGFTNKKATGATVIVDAGGEILDDATHTALFPGFAEIPGLGEMRPQIQDDGLAYRTEVGPVLLEAFQGFLGQTNWIYWGKSDYIASDFTTFPPTYVGENGGIAGVVFNTVTRAENEPQLAVGEGWEPGVPRVQVNLYADGDIDSPVLPPIGQPFAVWPNGIGDVDWNNNGIYEADDNVPDDINGIAGFQQPDVDNYPLGWGNPDCANSPAIPGNECNRGPEDVDQDDPTHTGMTDAAAVFDQGDAIAIVWTDSWDDNTPTNCQGSNQMTAAGIADNRCFDGMRNWNQVRPGVFDGGYAFADYDHTHLAAVNAAAETKIQAFYDYVAGANVPNADKLQLGLLPSDYIVEATTPPGYEALREHHKNVDLGDAYIPSSLQLQATLPVCVGEALEVPPYFALSTKDGSGLADQLIAGVNPADAAAPHAGEVRAVCDTKKVPLNAAQNAAADFFLVSETPVAANVTGIILNDLANEFNPNSPNFGEKYAPPLVPVAFYDWKGKQVNRVYADEFGAYNAMLPSTWNANLPQPSGMSPSMMIACMNDAGPIPDPNNPANLIVDPNFNPNFSQFCYNFNFMPGSTTYLDTPVLANAAYTSPVSYPVDCEIPTRTPMVSYVTRNPSDGAPGPFVVRGTAEPQRIQVYSRGLVTVPNPDWDGVNPATRTIQRDYSFAANDNLVMVAVNGGEPLTLATNLDVIGPNGAAGFSAEVPNNLAPGDYQLIVQSDYSDNRGFQEAPQAVTLTVGVCLGGNTGRSCTGTEYGVRENAGNNANNPNANQRYAIHRVAADGSGDVGMTKIQTAIDSASAGDLILVAPGMYDELLVMWKPVKIQGWGADRVILNARQFPTEKVQIWRSKIDGLLGANLINQLPGQANAIGAFPALGAPAFAAAEGAGIFVVGPDHGPNRFGIRRNRGARIDGLTVIGASNGGGIVVNGYASYLNIGNNTLTTNSGIFGGAIRLGEPDLAFEDSEGNLTYTDAQNDHVRIHHNRIVKNGATENGSGAGISLYTGSDQYRVHDNWICGNFSQSNGGGIGHLGESNGGRIERNDILFNESFSQANAANGGGIYLAGQVPLTVGGLSDGTGNVVINGNRIHGNSAGAGDGGAIAVVNANGTDIVNSRINNSNNYASGQWYDVSIFNNMITNNVAALAGAVTLQDSVEVHVQNNTIAHNDSTATAALAFTPGFPNQSNAQPAGVVSRVNTPALAALLGSIDNLPLNGGRLDEYRTFSDANLNNNIVYGNRSFYWLNLGKNNAGLNITSLIPANCELTGTVDPNNPPVCNVDDYQAYSDDLAVLDGQVNTGDTLFVRYNLLTDNTDNTTEYGPGNPGGNRMVFSNNPVFLNPVLNEGKDGLDIVEFTVLQTAGAFDEGGNFIQIAFGPLSIVDTSSDTSGLTLYDYHIGALSPAVSKGQNVGLNGLLGQDFDGDARTNGNTNEIGADER
jgi:large repetitive protein